MEGFNPRFLAREAERALERLLIQPLAAFLPGRLQLSSVTSSADIKKGELRFLARQL